MSAATRKHPVVSADRLRVRRSALRTGLWVGLASAAVLAVVTGVIVATLFTASRPDHRLPRADGPRGRFDRVVDLDAVLPVTVGIGGLGVLLLGVLAWYASRRAAEPLAQALEVQRAFVADASHELRTPLTTLNSRIQLAEHRLRQGDDMAGVLADMRRDAVVMDAVLTDLLTAAETAGAQPEDAEARAEVREVLQQAAALLAPRAEEAQVRLVVDAPASLCAASDATALLRAVVALLDNAVRLSPSGGAVVLRAVAAGGQVQVRVRDGGPGLDGMDPARIFERFARPSNSEERHGFGLGLALVRDVAARFGGSVRVEHTSASGTTFLLVLPQAR